jgi:hypothetical protein
MKYMKTEPLEGSNAGSTLQVYKEITGGTAYVPGRGADMVPSIVGNGAIGTYLVPEGKNPMEPASPAVKEVLFTLNSLTENQVEAARSTITGLIKTGQVVTKGAVMAQLSA